MGETLRLAGCGLCVLALLAGAGPALADGPLGTNGTPFRTSRYRIDLGAGPVIAGPRVTGLAGAYVALAEDVDGNAHNPAAPAVRPAHSFDHFDYYIGAGVIFTAGLTNSDFFNTGARSQAFTNQAEDAAVLSLATNLQWGTFGLGLSLDAQTFDMRPRDPAQRETLGGVQADILGIRIQAAHSMLDGQVIAGVGTRLLGMTLQDNSGNDLFATGGAAYEAGVLIRPNGRPFRVGAKFKSSAVAKVSPDSQLQPNAAGDILLGADTAQPAFLPDAVVSPWRLEMGAAVQLGPRPLNPRWIAPSRYNVPRALDMRRERLRRERDYAALIERARIRGDSDLAEALRVQMGQDRLRDARELRAFEAATRALMKQTYRSLPRRYLLISTALDIRGRSDNAVGIESFLQGSINRSGAQVTYSPRLGLEGELMPGRLRVRLGTYYEPTRFVTSAGRVHATLGASVRLLQWSVFGIWPEDQQWQLAAALDVSERYLGWGGAISSWY